MTWAKIDTALHRNPKVRLAGRNARDVYLFVVLANADTGADGELNAMILDPAYLADQLMCSEADAIDGVKRCETFQLLHVTGSIVSICGWDDEWKVKTSSDRVRKHRDKKKQEVAPDETLRNVTSVSCNGETHREIDRERERETESLAHPVDAPAFDFDSVYGLYPRKVGKSRGLKLCKSKVKSEAKYDTLVVAVAEMAQLWSRAGKDRMKFCPQFDTWISKDRWQDSEQLGPDGEAKPAGQLTPGQMLDRANAEDGY